MLDRLSKIASILILTAAVIGLSSPAMAEKKSSFKVAWSIYVGWMPWGWASDQGIVDKWAKKYGIEIDIVQINDYIESINQFTAGEFDGVTATNMDLLAIPSVGGIDTTALIIGDFSNGNDAVILKNKAGLKDIKGQKINLVELSVSHYLLARALDSIGLSERDITVVNTSDADMIAAYKTRDVTSVVTWNPLVSEILRDKTAKKVFDSSQIPGEIIDMTAVNTQTLKDNPNFGKALAGAWYETMTIMSAKTPQGAEARKAMGIASGTDQKGYESQLASTQMFYAPGDAVAFARSEELPKTMDLVRNFLFDHGLLGESAKNVDVVGIAFPNAKPLGNEANVKLRFDISFMSEAADGKL